MDQFVSIVEQKKIYDILDEISVNEFDSEEELLRHAIIKIIESAIFTITDGRLWCLDIDNHCYRLQYQYGQHSDLPDGYEINIDNEFARSTLLELSKKRSIIKNETDVELISHGIEHYSLTGIGQPRKVNGNKYFSYVLGFNGDEMNPEFQDTINIISRVIGVAVRHLEDEKKITKQNRDLVQAQKIQENLFPEHQKYFLDYDIYGLCIPDSLVGGDYFDYISSTDRLGDEHLSVVISDASSKGLPAAIQSLFVSGALKMGLAFSSRISYTMSRLNNLIFEAFPYERFVTMVYLELTKASNRLVLYSNAGHCPPIRYKTATDELKMLNPTGGLLGIVEDQQFEVGNTRMSYGDVMVLYTDGISEAMDGKGQEFGTDRIGTIIRDNHKLTSKEISVKILQAVNDFTVVGSYTDDKTLIVIKRNPKAPLAEQ